jgi:hypothetical protein
MDRVDYQSLVIQDLINLKKSDELDIAPWYQRRSVWNPAQKSYMINTLFEQKPIPAVYIRHSLNLEKSKSIKEVVDGQQRIRTILSFYENEFSAKHSAYINKVNFSELSSTDKQKFLLTSIPIGYLLGASDADVIDIFGRINSISKSLNAQEKRNAAFSGEMKQLCLEEASSRVSFWRDYGIFTANDIARMNEIQFISEVIYSFLNNLSASPAKKIDDMYKEYDNELAQYDEIKQRLNRVFDSIASLPQERVKDTIFNRQPIFFSLAIVLDSLDVIDMNKLENALLEMDDRFNAEENLSNEDNAFKKACTSTTQQFEHRKIRHDYIKSFLD